MCNRVRLMALAESLGGVETLISHPAAMTHASVPPERRAAIGLTDSLVRISAGIEDPADLIDDLGQALRLGVLGLVIFDVCARCFGDPAQVRVVAVDDRQHEELGHVVGVQFADPFPERDDLLARGLDDHLALGFLLDRPLPSGRWIPSAAAG